MVTFIAELQSMPKVSQIAFCSIEFVVKRTAMKFNPVAANHAQECFVGVRKDSGGLQTANLGYSQGRFLLIGELK